MSEEVNSPELDTTGGTDSQKTAEIKTIDAPPIIDTDTQQPIVSEYEKQLRRENAELRKEQQAFKAKQEAEKQKLLIEQGKYKELYETNASKVSEYEKELDELRALKSQITEQKEKERKDLIKSLPKEIKDVIDDTDSLEKIMKIKASFETALKPVPNSPLSTGGTTIPQTYNQPRSANEIAKQMTISAPIM